MEKWLQSIGLGEYHASFCSQSITIDQLGDLTDEDLRELGLTIGDRKRFRQAVALRTSPKVDSLGAAAVLETTRAERRPLTIMFVDLVNSSALGERLEPEDLLEVIRRYREFAGASIARFGGMIGRLVGDGILAYFCYPVATEHDPERAVRAALEIVRGIGMLETPAGRPLNVRIGIATGRVIVGDLFTAGRQDALSIIGSTPNLAARLQALAPPGGVVIAEETYARVGNVFICEDLGKPEMRGFEQTRNAWRVIGQASARATERRARHRMTPFYGRKEELGMLAERWQRASSGEGSTVLLTGEAGIGKSRLVEHFLATHVDSQTTVLRIAGSAFHEDSALYPVTAHLRRIARLEPDDSHIVQLKKLRSVLSRDDAAIRTAMPVVAELVGIPHSDMEVQALSPEGLRERLLSVLIEQFLLQAREKRLCLVVEDLHWLDPTSRELLGRIVETVAGKPAMILLTARDGFEATWMRQRATTVVRLVPLSPGEVAAMLQSLLSKRDIPAHLGPLIAQRTDGVPLFVEEVARALLQTSFLDRRAEEGIEPPDPVIPASLHELLMGRLDRSGVAKEIAQIAAVIGRTARRDVLAAVAALPDVELGQPLEALREAGALVQEFSDSAEGYTFSHELLREAAYDSLLRDERRRVHLSVARALIALDPVTVAHQPELLAMHLAEGNKPEEAAPYWLEAARRSLARSALTEATRLLKRGLDALEKLPASDAVKRLRLEMSGLLGPGLIGLKGPGSSEAQALYASAYTLCTGMPEEPSHFPIYWGWWRVSQDFHTWSKRSETILQRAVEHGHPEFLLQAHHSKWASHYHAGHFAQCCQHIEAGLAIYERGDYRHHATLYGNHDPKVCAHGEWAQVLWMQGRPRSAFDAERVALSWAEALDHHGSRVHAFDTSLLHRVYRRDYAEVFRRSAELVTFTSAHALSDHRSKGLIFRGWITATQEDPAAGLRTLLEGLAHQRSGTAREDFPVYLCLLAEARVAAGRPDQAAEELKQALEEFDRLGLHSWRPEVLRVLGEATLAADASATAQADSLFHEAARIADRQGAVMLRLRTAVSQARLDLRLDRVSDSGRQLNSAIAAIAEADDGHDLREARLMADRLRMRLGTPAAVTGGLQ
nr:AAA family ATPase [uncultured Rhodopila sp.]